MNHPVVFLHWDNRADLVPAYCSCFSKFIRKKSLGYKVAIIIIIVKITLNAQASKTN